jgi:drug/metabolite transporter (DMT)-like permease
MAGGAILLWSLAPACIVVVGKQLGVWQFLAIAALLSGTLQVVGYLALGRTLRSILLPPPKLWIAIALGFIFYLLLFTTGMVTARTETQAVGVSLMNYLWPTLAIVFTTWVVPGERLHGRLAMAGALSLAGVLLANGADLALPDPRGTLWPYALGGAAAVSWAAYCALASRWRSWAKNYAAAPMGFLIVGAIGAGMCYRSHGWQPMDARSWAGVLLISLGPWAGGYMLWEMALHRVSGVTLGLLGALTPVLATLNLIGLFALTAPGRVSGARIAVLLAAALLISAAVALGRSSSAPRKDSEAGQIQ